MILSVLDQIDDCWSNLIWVFHDLQLRVLFEMAWQTRIISSYGLESMNLSSLHNQLELGIRSRLKYLRKREKEKHSKGQPVFLGLFPQSLGLQTWGVNADSSRIYLSMHVVSIALNPQPEPKGTITTVL